MATYVGINGGRKLVECCIGINGVRRNIKEIYIGQNGVPRLVWMEKAPPGQQIFTSSGTFVVPEKVKQIDVFLVGGGGSSSYNYSPGIGGPSGFTKTIKGIAVTPGQKFSVGVGAAGGTSSFGNYSANGGKGVGGYPTPNSYDVFRDISPSAEGDIIYGGSAGGTFCYIGSSNYAEKGGNAVSGATNGGSTASYDYYGIKCTRMQGQGSTTRAFGEGNNTLYASGGNNIVANNYNRLNGTPNTGNGAGGCWKIPGISDINESWRATIGGSGIVIVRWGY